MNTIVDGAQAVGHIEVDVESPASENRDIDFYIGCGHKWLCAPETVGFVRVGRRFNNDCRECQALLSSGDIFKDGTAVDIPFEGAQSGTHQRGLARAFRKALQEFLEESSKEAPSSLIKGPWTPQTN